MSIVDKAKTREFMGRMIGYMTGGAACFGIWLGDELGLYRALAHNGARTADELAADTDCNPRLVREWLDAQAAARLLTYDPEADRYELSPEGAMALRRRPGFRPPARLMRSRTFRPNGTS